jgi:hypothetical protein
MRRSLLVSAVMQVADLLVGSPIDNKPKEKKVAVIP